MHYAMKIPKPQTLSSNPKPPRCPPPARPKELRAVELQQREIFLEVRVPSCQGSCLGFRIQDLGFSIFWGGFLGCRT